MVLVERFRDVRRFGGLLGAGRHIDDQAAARLVSAERLEGGDQVGRIHVVPELADAAGAPVLPSGQIGESAGVGQRRGNTCGAQAKEWDW